MTTHHPGARRLGDAVRDRRSELGLTQEQLADRAHVHVNVIGNLEAGRAQLRRVTGPMQRVERALGWGPRSLTSIRDGGEPTRVVERQTTDDLSQRLPVTVAAELDDGEIIDYEFTETKVDGVRRVIVTIKDPNRPPLSRDERRRLARRDDTTARDSRARGEDDA